MTNPSDVPPVKPDPSDDDAKATSPHDALFHRTFSKPENAAPELRCILGEKLASRFDWASMTSQSDKFIDAKLTGKHADVLFSVRMSGRETLLYILMEHKSKPDPWTPLQLLEYKVRIWRTYIGRRKNKGKKKLPVILAVLVHHTPQGWKPTARFSDLFDIAPEDAELLQPYMLDFGILIDDIGKLSAEAIVQRPVTPEAQIVLFVLRFGRTPHEFFRQVPLVWPMMLMLQNARPEDLAISSVIRYLKTVNKMKEEDVSTAIREAVGMSDDIEGILFPERQLARATARARKEGELSGIRKGKRKGKLEGKREGELALVKRQLAQRFGALPTHAVSRIDAAKLEELEAMSMRLLDAKTLEEVLENPANKAR